MAASLLLSHLRSRSKEWWRQIMEMKIRTTEEGPSKPRKGHGGGQPRRHRRDVSKRVRWIPRRRAQRWNYLQNYKIRSTAPKNGERARGRWSTWRTWRFRKGERSDKARCSRSWKGTIDKEERVMMMKEERRRRKYKLFWKIFIWRCELGFRVLTDVNWVFGVLAYV